ncbi:hypothetical protein AN641_06860 [Candidatus Epulonipiscioides gigas]|nr:hypothetical protein AN641_06860 [Epulopiscium sp. SCG-C07WGA-EpuloA2]
MWFILILVTLICYIKYKDNIFKLLLLSSILTFISSSIINSLITQFFLFIFYFITGILFTGKKYLFKSKKIYNFQNFIGKTAIVTQTANKNKIITVKFNGNKWSAKSSDILKKGDTVIIIKIEGLILYVIKN